MMNFFQKKPEERAANNPYDNVLSFNGFSGFSNSKSLTLSTVYRCVEVISNGLAQLPFEVRKDGKHHDCSINKMLNRPNRYMTRFQLIKSMVCDMLLAGNAYAYINNGQLTYVPSGAVVSQTINKGELIYKVQSIGEVTADKMIHILNYPDSTGLRGVSTLTYAANTLEISYSAENTAKGFFKNGCNLSGFLKTIGAATAQQKKEIKQTWMNAMSNNDGGVMVIDGNMSFEKLQLNPQEVQLLESRKFDGVQICKFFNISPLKAFDLSGNSYSSSEMAEIQFLNDCLSPIIVKFEQEFSRKLFPNDDCVVNIDESALLRTDKQSQAEYLTKLTANGLMSINEARASLGLAARPEGDELHIQLNMTKVNKM